MFNATGFLQALGTSATWEVYSLWMYTLNLGVAFGAGYYENQVVVPLWIKFERSTKNDKMYDVVVDSAEMRRMDPGRKFWAFVSTIPLTALTITQLFTKRFNGRHESAALTWLKISSTISCIERAMTFTFFIPNAIKLMNAEMSDKDDSTKQIALRWTRLNYARLLLSGLAWITAMKALTTVDSLSQ